MSPVRSYILTNVAITKRFNFYRVVSNGINRAQEVEE